MNEFCKGCPDVPIKSVEITVNGQKYNVVCSPNRAKFKPGEQSGIDIDTTDNPHLTASSGFCHRANGHYIVRRID